MYEEVEHTADYAIHIQSETLAGLLLDAARGMVALTGAHAEPPHVTREIDVTAADKESLLVAWLEELAFLLEVEGLLFDKFEIVAVSTNRLRVRAAGGQAQRITRLIKAVTFHDLTIHQTPTGFETTVVLDV